MENQLFIPKKIKVGYQYRDDTYTKKLAYIIYYDAKGKLRKESSWKSWIHRPERWENPNNVGTGYGDMLPEDVNPDFVKSFEPSNFDNVPIEGFVLNKGVGGQRESYGWNARNEYIRVYDPRGWEFEISVKNLLYILQEVTSTKGKGLEGEFVYSWSGKDLVLLPTESQDYKNSMEYTLLQDIKLGKKDMEVGSIYLDKNQHELIYLGRHRYIRRNYHSSNDTMKHIFLDIESNGYIAYPGFTKLAKRLSDTSVDNYAELLDEYLNSKYHELLKELVFKPFEEKFKSIDDINVFREFETEVYLLKGGNYQKVIIREHSGWKDRLHIKMGYFCYYKGIPTPTMINGEYSELEHIAGSQSWQYNKNDHGDLLTEEEVLNLPFYKCYTVLTDNNKILIGDYLKLN